MIQNVFGWSHKDQISLAGALSGGWRRDEQDKG